MAEDVVSLESTSAEALVSLRESRGNSYNTSSVRRGYPQRSRKPNPKFEDPAPLRLSPKAKKTPRASHIVKPVLTKPDKKVAQAIGVRLRNLLKLPKAHKWVCYEWFGSSIDRALFEGENDFCICLRESFPQIKSFKMTRVQWCMLRRLMGKPRRCSPAFFAEERDALDSKRQRIRLLQQRKSEGISLKDLPEEIPMPLVIGTKVTARLRKPQDGLFTGVIDALDTVRHTYRVTFDRPGLGTHSIPDTEVLSNVPQETMPLNSYQAQSRISRSNVFSPPRFIREMTSPHLENDPLLGASPMKEKLSSLEEGTYGGFPVKFLMLVTRLNQVLGLKKNLIKELQDMNTEAEKTKSYNQDLPAHFQQKYAAIVLELDRLNKDLNDHLLGVQRYCQQIAPEHGMLLLHQPDSIRQRCDGNAEELVVRLNINGDVDKKIVKSERLLQLVVKLTSLLLQMKIFSETEMHSFEFKSLKDTLDDIHNSVNTTNMSIFQNDVEVNVNHIQSGLSQLGNLHAFTSVSTCN